MTTLIDRITTAIARNNLPALRKLVTRENANLVDEDGFTLVMNVILDEDAGPELLHLLIERGADVNVADSDLKYTVLHFAARDQRKEMVEILLAAGALADPMDALGTTPLCHCVQRLDRDLEIVRLLLARGADPEKRNKDGDSPLNIARFAEDDELFAFLKASSTKRKPSPSKAKPTPAKKKKKATAKAAKPMTKKKAVAKAAKPAAKGAKTPRKKITDLMTIAPVTQQRVAAGTVSSRTEERNIGWPPEHAKLWKALVPRSGKAKTVQGELIRLTGRLTDEAFRNGNINWSDATVSACKFVGKTLDDPAVFSAAERAEIKRQVRWILRHITQVPVEPRGSAYYVLANRAVQWSRQHDQPIPLPPSDAYDF